MEHEVLLSSPYKSAETLMELATKTWI